MACLCLQNVCVCSLMSDSSQPPWIIAHQALPSMEFSRQEYWNGLSFPTPGDLPHPGIEPGFPALQAESLPTEQQNCPQGVVG